MALTDLHVSLPPMPLLWGNSSVWRMTFQTLDAASERIGAIFQAPATGNITKIRFRTNTVTTGGDFTVNLETVGTTGLPSGTLWDSPTNQTTATVTIADTDDSVWKEATLTAAAAVTKGDFIALTITAPSGVNVRIAHQENYAAGAFPYMLTDLGGSGWTKVTAVPIFGVEYSGGAYHYIPGMPGGLASAVTVDTDGNDECGNRIDMPVDARVVGLWVIADLAAGETVDAILYNNAGTAASTLTVDGDASQGAYRPRYFLFASAVTVAAGDVLRIVLKSATATNQFLGSYAHAAAAHKNQLPSGSVVQRTERDAGGAWSDVDTDYMMIGLVLDQLDDGAGGGGSMGISQGLHGIGTGIQA